MPAEWEPHLATYLVWPHNRDTWPGKFEPVPPAFAKLAAAIARFEPVRLLVNDEAAAVEAQRLLADELQASDTTIADDRIDFIQLSTNDSWVRDHGPIFVNRRAVGTGPAQIAIDWHFNSWGAKYGPYNLDDVVPRRLGEQFGFEVIEPDLVLEGGSIDVNGDGLLLTTEQCLLNPNRNSALSRAEIEEYLKVYLGARKILWLGEGIAGDDTDGHVDDLARFVGRDTIVTTVEADPADENFIPLQENLRRLRTTRNLDGHPFRLELLPMPPPLFHEGTRLPASYANFYFVNGGLVMPSFDAPSDLAAREMMQRLFPQRTIVTVPSIDLVWGLGSVHCLTQQHPLA
ncbi:MAG: agmatine deiminase family protein [Candidatus Binataceae bacterium]|nr:agmatine deiminase family protein [Candidatus Binataceae bacterium]